VDVVNSVNTSQEQEMITILSALICLKAVCYQVTVPTPISLEMDSCVHVGELLAKRFVDPRWSVKAIDCRAGREV
jgi:hypothetical protein